LEAGKRRSIAENEPMAEPFAERSGGSGGILSRVRGRKSTFVAELENSLAHAARVVDVRPEQIEEIAERHAVDLAQSVRTPRRNLYRRLLEHCLADHELSPNESADLSHLRTILKLPDEEIRAIHDDVARVFYGRAMDQVLDDYHLDPEEEQFLRRLRSDLGICEELAGQLREEGSGRARQRFLSRTIANDSVVVAPREIKLELTGSSETTLEDAVRRAIDEANRAGAQLLSAELTEIRVELRDETVGTWCVKLKATLSPQ
jgi:flavin-binding protein dodecin/DNA-directed RNA polymerase subunit F